MHFFLVVPMVLLMHLGAAATTFSSAAADDIALDGCESKCGDVDVPYPFGASNGCHRTGFKVTCHRAAAQQPKKPFLWPNGPEVLSVNIRNSTARVRGTVWSFAVGTSTTNGTEIHVLPVNLQSTFALSAARNSLVVVGCGFHVALARPAAREGDGDDVTFGTCAPLCPGAKQRKLRHGPCDGVGCCEVPVPAVGLASFRVRFAWVAENATARPGWVAPGASVFAVEREWWRDRENVVPIKLSLLSSSSSFAGNASGLAIPSVLDWTLSNSSCAAAKRSSDFGCGSRNSECVDSVSSAYGYVCRCSDGYDGNPYVPRGCRGPRMNIPAGVYFAMGVGIGMFLLLLVVAAIFGAKRLKVRKARKTREHFFKQNRGLLLQQLVDKDIAERMIFSLEELEKATNKFDPARILGGGGHGTVYKGILSNQRVVAIKKSTFVVQREIDGFVNEVAILSQINHRNVVKLYGCCLETEVPLLVYEFIPNGTLYEHLHVESTQSRPLLPWKDRLRIATEVASSLAYLHSAASTSVVHRDIKTANILLDDHLTAKVSDFGASRGISIDQSSVTTPSIQGTYGYLDPEYFYMRRLTDKSDVYSYGVMLVELLTRKKPTMLMSSEGVGLVAHFILSLNQGQLNEVLDELVIEEGEEEAEEVVAIAAMCLKLKGEDRPTMRNVEMRLHALRGTESNNISITEEELTGSNIPTFKEGNAGAGDKTDNYTSRHYSLEEEFLFSASFQR
ncbi:hypothetical protein PR202_gb02759 [Eleusine coracana subsp. coracana]|uniref:Protein kinase domain-containing protein n=1 Tax=Eleusine coracana subsp. coracana TaxID=191504 RepID=A0AAV5E015_ELECO|nr:hypothetical protein PR202_gb02759 [Eleusine coracana subsp. coracana]